MIFIPRGYYIVLLGWSGMPRGETPNPHLYAYELFSKYESKLKEMDKYMARIAEIINGMEEEESRVAALASAVVYLINSADVPAYASIGMIALAIFDEMLQSTLIATLGAKMLMRTLGGERDG